MDIKICFITIIILLLLLPSSTNVYSEMLVGFYEADSSFCEESGLDTFSIYINNDIYCNNRAGYILMIKDGEFIINDPINMRINMHIFNWNNWVMNPYKPKKFTIEIDGLEDYDDLDDVFPNKQTLEFYPLLGKIVLYNRDTITAILYKNGFNSEVKTMNDI